MKFESAMACVGDDTPLDKLSLSTRARTVLTNDGCTTLADVRKLSDADLKRTPNCGSVTICEINHLLGRIDGTVLAKLEAFVHGTTVKLFGPDTDDPIGSAPLIGLLSETIADDRDGDEASLAALRSVLTAAVLRIDAELATIKAKFPNEGVTT